MKVRVRVRVTMVADQRCKKCRTTFPEDSIQLDYQNYARFGFKNEDQFRKHNAGNKRCPCKQLNLIDNVPNEQDVFHDHLAIWSPYEKNIHLDGEDDYADDQHINQTKLNKHNRGGRSLWFHETEEAAANILSLI